MKDKRQLLTGVSFPSIGVSFSGASSVIAGIDPPAGFTVGKPTPEVFGRLGFTALRRLNARARDGPYGPDRRVEI